MTAITKTRARQEPGELRPDRADGQSSRPARAAQQVAETRAGRRPNEADPDKDYSDSDNVTPVLVTTLIGLPILAVCCLGPVFYASIAAWTAGWLSGIGPITAVALAAIAGILAWVFVRRRQAKRSARRRAAASRPTSQPSQTNWTSR